MEIVRSSGNFRIIDSDVVFLADPDADFTLHFCEQPDFEITLEMKFIKNESEGYSVKRRIDGTKICYECVNFTEAGTGTTEPIELTTFDGKQMYIMFWSYLQGKSEGKKQARKIEYTIFLER